MRRYIWFFGFLAALTVSFANAQSTGGGVLNAVSFLPLTADMTIKVQTLDNSDENLMLVDEVNRSLADRGYTITDSGSVILTVGSTNEIGAWSTTDRRHVLEVQGQASSHSDETRIKLNLFDSNTGGILNKGTSGTTIVTPSQFVVEISVDNAADGKRHWQAWAAADLVQTDRAGLIHRMVPALIAVLGDSVTDKAF